MRTRGPFPLQEGLRQKEALYGAVFSVLRQMQELGTRGRILIFGDAHVKGGSLVRSVNVYTLGFPGGLSDRRDPESCSP